MSEGGTDYDKVETSEGPIFIGKGKMEGVRSKFEAVMRTPPADLGEDHQDRPAAGSDAPLKQLIDQFNKVPLVKVKRNPQMGEPISTETIRKEKQEDERKANEAIEGALYKEYRTKMLQSGTPPVSLEEWRRETDKSAGELFRPRPSP